MKIPKWMEPEIKKIVNEYNEKEPSKTLKQIRTLVYKNKPSNRTITWRYSAIKFKLKSISKMKKILNLIKPSDELTRKVIEANSKKRDNDKRLIVTSDFIKKIMSFEHSKNPYEMYIWLLLISGRRLHEILKSKFVNVPRQKTITMIGVTKKKSKNIDDIIIKFTPLVAKTRFFKVYKRLMKVYKYSNIKNISYNLQINIKKKLGKEYKSHQLRGIYAMYLYTFRNKQNDKINTFIKNVLNHDSIDSSLSYTGITFDFNKDIIK